MAAKHSKRVELDRGEYFAERKLLIEARQRAYQRGDQLVIAGAAGALVLSIGFIEKLAPASTVTSPWILASAWVILLFGLALALFGQYVAGKSFDGEIACLDASAIKAKPPDNRWGTWTTRLSLSSFVALVLGIGLLAWFAYTNAPFNRG